ncbi:carboxypeptidase-like regulatory domain-containing protein [Marivirga salinae]|uniref:Carboxypeptidase-like regulatory domain-containing protein n=1 Tax=Marivirga salinarum TaxID=3059078 RepID=A0AA49GBU0_9BACT|nr:carboxypeptidase-like regulatory domain-containing protein [Marivirga sp. BDSF4-3]WKK78049.2 carboxypeptidase-like regulatory domain-containing protein [Marivirga sp. BDSF4-3]
MRNKLLLIVSVFLFNFSAFAQIEQVIEEPINITGVILDAENMEPIPFTTVLIGDGKSGTVADNSGYFSFLAYPGDTITFRSVGYRNSTFIIPELLDGKTYSLIELMVQENVLLEEVKVYPLPDADYFTNTIVKTELTDIQKKQLDDFKKDLNNLLQTKYENENPYYDQWRYARLYEMTGIVPPNNFLNPMTWSNFIRDWKKDSEK